MGNANAVDKPGFFHTRQGRQAVVIFAFSVIPLCLLILFTYLPFAEMIQYSFYKMRYIGARQFVGLDNYAQMFKREYHRILNTLSILYGGCGHSDRTRPLPCDDPFDEGARGRAVERVDFFPYLINGIAIGFIFKFFYTRGFVLDTVLQWVGFNLDSLPYWLKDQSVNNWLLVASSCWRYLGQNMVLFIGAIMSVDETLYEAADLDGANQWHKFKYIILPSIKTIVTLNIILSITGSLSAFEAPYVITNGNNGTGTFFVVMNKIAHTDQKVGLASAMAVFLLVIIFIATLLQNLLFKYVFRNATTGEEMDAAAIKANEKKLKKQQREERRAQRKGGGA